MRWMLYSKQGKRFANLSLLFGRQPILLGQLGSTLGRHTRPARRRASFGRLSIPSVHVLVAFPDT